MRASPPHLGHVVLLESLLSRAGTHALLIGSSDVDSRADVPLPWGLRREVLLALLDRRGVDHSRLVIAPLPELKTNGWDTRWCEYVLGAASTALGQTPTRYVFGSDYQLTTFIELIRCAPGLELERIPRALNRSGRELRAAIARSDSLTLAGYQEELSTYPMALLDLVVRYCSQGVDRP
jgi:hypothetical protein